MNGNIEMRGADACTAKFGYCYITIDNQRYLFMQAKDISLEIQKTKQKVDIMGKVMSAHKSTGAEGTGSAKFHYNTSLFNEQLVNYCKSGKDIYFDLQITNDDPTTSVGRQTVTAYDCNLDGGVIAQIISDDSLLEQSFDFTFDDCDLPEKFVLLSGMKV